MTAYQADTVFVPVIPSFRGFGDAMTRGTQQAAAEAGRTAGQTFSDGAAKGAKQHQGNGLADYFFSPALNAAATKGGAGTGRAFATGISRALVGSVTTSIGNALGTAITSRVSARLSQTSLFSGFAKNAQRGGAAAGTAAGQQVASNAQRQASRVNWGVLNNRKLAVVAVGAGVLFGRRLASSAERQAKASFHPDVVFSGLKYGALGAATAVAGVLGGALAKGGARLEAIDSARGKLQGLGHDAKTVDKIMNDALLSVKGTAFGLDEAATVSASAVAAGIKPGQQLQSTLKLIADTATIGNSTLTDTGAIFTKIASSNKVYNDTLNQLGDQGIPIVELLGKKLGVSSEDVRKLASQGKIDFKTFKSALQDGLGGAALASGDTFQGALKNAGAAYSRFGADLLKGAFPQLKGVFGDVTKTLDEAGPDATRLGEKIGSVFADTVRLAHAAEPVLGSLGRLLGGTFNPFIKSIGGGQGALESLTEYVSTHQAEITGFLVSAGHTAISFGKGLAGAALTGIKSFQALNTGVNVALVGILKAASDLTSGLAIVARPIDPKLADSLEDVSGKLDGMATHAIDKSKAMNDSLQGAADGIKNGLLPALDQADVGLTKIGNSEISKAQVRDAIAGIGTAADGSQIKLKKLADVTKLSADQQAGLRLRLKDAASALRGQYDAIRQAGGGQKQLTAAWKEGKDRLYDEFRQMGLSREAAKKLAAQYAGVKPKVMTKVSQPGMSDAISDTKKLGLAISGLKNRPVKITYSTNAEKIVKSTAANLGYDIGGPRARGGIVAGKARGGVLPGFTPLSRGDDIAFPMTSGRIQPLRGGEGIAVSEAMRDPFERSRLLAVNKAALRGESLTRFREPGLASGGLTRSITTRVDTSKLGIPDFGALTDVVANAIGDPVGKAIGHSLRSTLKKITGGGNTGKALAYAKDHAGHPYQFGTLWDCSGFISALHSIAKGESPHRRYVTTDFHGSSAKGFTRGKRSNFMVGVNPKPGKSGHMAGTVNGTNVESRGGDGVVVGKRARGWNNSLFSWRGGLAAGGIVPGDLPFDLVDRRGKHFDPSLRAAVQRTPLRTALFDDGGYLQPGLTLAYNGTGRPERIRTEVQERQAQQTAARPVERHHHYHGPEAADLLRQSREIDRVDDVMAQFRKG